MKNKRSKKHHYLPRYYLKGFTNSDDCFFVYDKCNDKIFLTNPDSSFFINKLNTVTLPDGNQSDFLESSYAEIESQSWNSLDNVRNSTRKTPIEYSDKIHLFHFLLFLHWRLPNNIKYVEKLSKKLFQDNSELDFFKLYSKTSNTVPQEILERLRNSPAFKKSARMIVPFVPFFKDKNWWRNLENWRFFYTGDEQNWFIVGDNPFVTRGTRDHDPVNCLKEFIFPVSGKILLVSGFSNLGEMVPPEFTIQFNAAIIERAHRFVACQSKFFLEKLVEYYKQHVQFGKTGYIIKNLFENLEETEVKRGSITKGE